MKRVLRTMLKVSAWGIAAVAVALLAAHLVWKYSGTGTWELAINKKGVKVYTMKVPGETVMRFKATTRVKTSLNRAVMAMVSTKTEDCADWMPGCLSKVAIQPWDSKKLTYTHLYSLDLPSPFRPRDFVIKAKVTQNPADKSVLVKFDAAPDEAPLDACCVRVEKLDNHWRFTPAGNGEVEVESMVNGDQKVPYFMANRFAPRSLYVLCRRLQKFLDQEKWQHARYDGIVEPQS